MSYNDLLEHFNSKSVVTMNMLKCSELWDEVPQEYHNMKARQILWHLTHKVSVPECANIHCSHMLKWNTDRNQYTQYCSARCRARCDNFKQKLRESNIHNNRTAFSFQNSDAKHKRKETMINRYGYEFSLESITPPAYFYIWNGKRTHCSRFTKSNIKRMFPVFKDSTKTEAEMMDELKIIRFYDSGKCEWLWKES